MTFNAPHQKKYVSFLAMAALFVFLFVGAWIFVDKTALTVNPESMVVEAAMGCGLCDAIHINMDGGGGGGGEGGGGGGGGFVSPYCTILATPNLSPTPGGPVTLTWTTRLATTATINNGVGAVTPVLGGSVVVYPTANTTYTMTTTGTSGGATCQVTVTVPPPTQTGCIQVLKETYDTNGDPLTPVAQFTFKLDGSATALNDANGNAIFNNVTSGVHTVTEILPPTWELLSTTPENGIVIVTPGPVCAAVVFKNKQVINIPPPPPPVCTLDLSNTTLTWTTTNATSVVITPVTNSPVVPLPAAPGGTTFTVSVDPHVIAAVITDASTNGGVTGATFTNAGFYPDAATMNRVCHLVEAGSVATTFGSRSYNSPGNNSVLLWNGTNWVRVGARSYNSHLQGAITCRRPSGTSVQLLNGSHTFVPPLSSNTHTYLLTATGPGGTVTCTDTITPPPPPPQTGCILIKKETYNTLNQPITPVAQFTFKLDGNAQTTQNDAAGNAIFTNVSAGVHSVTEIVPATWTQLSVTPVNGSVTVTAGPTCAAVVFKNKQTITATPPVKISAKKIVCNTETDLPNMSNGANITSTTVSDFLATHPNCHLETGWKWQYADGDTGNPGDNVDVASAGTDWITFVDDNTDGVAEAFINLSSLGDASKIWMREAIPPDYIPFTGVITNNVSPEMYCHTDVLNYDNYDAISNPVSGTTYHCVAWNVKKPANAPTCTLNSNPNTLTAPGASTLTWTTTNATSFTINQGVGSVTPVPGGSVGVNVVNTTTYVGTATGPGGTVNCPTTVTLTPPGPACTLTISKTSIRTGESITLSWTSSNVTSGTIDNNAGAASPVSSGTTVDLFPSVDTTYTGTFTGPNGTVTCTKSVTVTTGGGGCQGNCGGGGYNPPNVVMYKKPGESGLVASVFLSQIPYTGFEAGPALTTLFWLAVGLLAALIAYFAAGRRGFNMFSNHLAAYVGVPTAQELQNAMGGNRYESDSYDASYEPTVAPRTEMQNIVAQSVVAPVLPMPITVTPIAGSRMTDGETGIPALSDVIESRAHAAGVLMSPEAVQFASKLSPDRTETLKTFGEILNEAVRTVPREDGWIMLTSDRLEDIASKTPSKNVTQQAPVATVVASVSSTPIVEGGVRTYTYGERADEASAVAFVSAIVSGNRDAAFSIIRSLEHASVSPATLMTSTATVLDRLYRVRQGGKNGVDKELLNASMNVNDENLHKLVEVFTHSLDIVYTNPFTGVKLALAQAFEVVG